MSKTVWAFIVMSSEIEEERIRGIQYGHDAARLVPLNNGAAIFFGDHDIHSLEWDGNGNWRCSCRTFRRLHQVTDCRHIIAAKRILRQCALSTQPGAMEKSIIEPS